MLLVSVSISEELSNFMLRQVRALFDDKGKRVDEAGPSIPVQV